VEQPPVARSRLSFRRLSGLDRSGPPPAQTTAGAPLNPWTIPNAIGYFRAALLPVFLVIAFSAHGQSALTAITFGLVGWGDYFDGIAARVTGQYSRLGALMDPVIDRGLILSGAVVCFWFDLLPRWALVVLALREVAVFALARYGLSRGVDIRVNWLGRLGVWPVMSALFFPMTGLETLGAILLYVGLCFALASAAQYARDGVRALRAAKPSTRA
jgi:CDP-diacylglycerol--glycerol-3-phosphate 3-phosphatidyltransferase